MTSCRGTPLQAHAQSHSWQFWGYFFNGSSFFLRYWSWYLWLFIRGKHYGLSFRKRQWFIFYDTVPKFYWPATRAYVIICFITLPLFCLDGISSRLVSCKCYDKLEIHSFSAIYQVNGVCFPSAKVVRLEARAVHGDLEGKDGFIWGVCPQFPRLCALRPHGEAGQVSCGMDIGQEVGCSLLSQHLPAIPTCISAGIFPSVQKRHRSAVLCSYCPNRTIPLVNKPSWEGRSALGHTLSYRSLHHHHHHHHLQDRHP